MLPHLRFGAGAALIANWKVGPSRGARFRRWRPNPARKHNRHRLTADLDRMNPITNPVRALPVRRMAPPRTIRAESIKTF